eukprot:761334-Hanusia_phi.AAC.2
MSRGVVIFDKEGRVVIGSVKWIQEGGRVAIYGSQRIGGRKGSGQGWYAWGGGGVVVAIQSCMAEIEAGEMGEEGGGEQGEGRGGAGG